MKKKLFVVLLAIVITALSGCGYSESYVNQEKRKSYDEGYDKGYQIGSYHQHEKDVEEMILDGMSIYNVRDMVLNKYGVTPSQAFAIVDEYEYDSTHGGITWDEYQNAIEAIYYTAQVFPVDY